LLGLDEVKTIYFHAVVTRLDLTVDCLDMEPNLYIQKEQSHSNPVIIAKLDGKLSSQIIWQ